MNLQELYALYNYLLTYLDKELPARASFAIARFLSQSETDYNCFKEKQIELIKRYGAKENGELVITDGNYIIPPEQLESFQKELSDLAALEIDAPKLELYYSDLENLKLTPRDFATLMPYIKE